MGVFITLRWLCLFVSVASMSVDSVKVYRTWKDLAVKMCKLCGSKIMEDVNKRNYLESHSNDLASGSLKTGELVYLKVLSAPSVRFSDFERHTILTSLPCFIWELRTKQNLVGTFQKIRAKHNFS